MRRDSARAIEPGRRLRGPEIAGFSSRVALSLLAFLILAGTGSRGQSADDASIYRFDKTIVVGSPWGDGDANPVRATIDPSSPALTRSWDTVTGQVANLRVETAGAGSFGAIYSLRGLANTPYFSDPAVTLYFDDLPLASSFGYPTDLFGFASAMVFYGSRPTQFGRSGDGGVIVFTLPNQATRSGGELNLGIGNFEARSIALVADAAAGEDGGGFDRADVRVAATYARRDGPVTNTQLGETVGDLGSETAFIRGRFRPAGGCELSLEILADRHRDGAQPLVPLDGPLTTVERSHEGESDSDLFGAALKGIFDTGIGRLTTVTSATHWKLDPYGDWLVLPPALQSTLSQAQEAWNEELHLSSDSRGGVSWSLGSWLSAGSTSGAVMRSIQGVFPIEKSGYRFTTREAALFGEIVYTPTSSWLIEVGARGQRTEKDYHQDEQVPTAGPHFHLERNDGAWLPRIAVTHELGPGTKADASVSFGSRPGGFAAYTDNPSLIPFAAEHTTEFETGLMTSMAQKALQFEARVFDYEIDNDQIERSFSPTDYFVANAPRARSLGAELRGTWRPAAAWTIDANAGLERVTLLEFHDPLTGRSYAGDRAPYAPAYSAGFEVAYRSVGGWFAAADASVTGKTFYTESENPRYAQGGYVVLNGRIGFESSRLRITVFAANAADKGYYTLIVPGVDSAAPGMPRTVGTEFAVKF